MRKIITTTFVTLDGVMQAPGGPKEDTTGGFAYGGWSMNYWDSISGKVMSGFMNIPFELLLGKRTYDIFAGYWPGAKTDLMIAEKFNNTKKYVVSNKLFEPSWHNSICVTGDVEKQIKKLKDHNGPDLWVHGSGNLIQTLLKYHLIDRMHMWTCPVTVGGGKRLFENGTQAEKFKLIESITSTKGVIITTYEPIGTLKAGL
ncbi:MAG: dihydrofolate reductase family protein [Endomicrobiales bacterium]|jgi:dihydrofolate reductase